MSLPDGRSITTLKVNDLKKELEKRGLSKSGVKKDLVERLELSLQQSAEEDESSENESGINDATNEEAQQVIEVEESKKETSSTNEVLEESNDTEASNQEVQEPANEVRVPSPVREEKPAAAEVEKAKEPEIIEAAKGGDGDEERSDDDHEILQGNVSDDEAITGGMTSPDADTGPSAMCVGGGKEESRSEVVQSTGGQSQAEGDNDELEEGEMRDEEDERDVKLSGSRAPMAQPHGSAGKDAPCGVSSGSSGGGGGGGGIRKRQWGIRRPSAKTYVEVPLSSQALNTLVEMNAAAAAEEEEEEEEAAAEEVITTRAKDRLSESAAGGVAEGEGRQVLVEEPMEEGEVPSTPASELVSSAPPLAILTADDGTGELEEAAMGEGTSEGGEGRRKLRPASPPTPSPVLHDASPPKPSSPTSKARKKGLRETRAVGYHVEDPIRGRPVEAALLPESDTVHIRGLVRPFTLNQLKDLLSRFGNLQSFWIDRVKSKAFVRFESTEEAANAREDLDGCKWPSINPRLLRVDFSSQEELEWMMEHGESGKPFPKAAPVASARTSAGGKSGVAAAAGPEKAGGEARKEESSAPLRERNRERAASPSEARKRPRGRGSRSPSGGRYRSADREREGGKAGAAPMREWDRDKIRQSDSPPARRARRRSRSRSREKGAKAQGAASPTRRASKERTAAKEKEQGGEGKAAPVKEEPARLLDDLFRKTKVVPSIYWLPLTEEQIKVRQREREERSKRQNRTPSGPERAELLSRGQAGPSKGQGPGGRYPGAGSGRRRSRSRSRSRRREWDSRRR